MGSGTSTRVPILFKAKVGGMVPNTTYKYCTRAMNSPDFTSTGLFAGAGVILGIDTGGWKQISSTSFSSGTGHDTLTSNMIGEYEGWFGFFYTNNSRFTAGNFITPGITLVGPDTLKFRLTDSIKVLAFDSSGTNANAGTAIWGSSFAAPKNIIALYDAVVPSNRPLTITYAENEGLAISNTPAFYTNNVNGKNGNWGTIIPNNLSSGVRRIENINLKTGFVSYANTDADGTWGVNSKKTVNPRGGTITPIKLDSLDCPLIAPVVEFWARTSSTTEASGTMKVFVSRKWSNSTTQSVVLKVAGGDATKGTTNDYDLTEPKTIVFNPGLNTFDTTTITINNDNIVEGDETIVLRLETPSNTTIGTEVAHTITVKDDDIPYFSITKAVSVKETAGKIGFAVKVDKAMSTPAQIKLSVKSKGLNTNIPSEFKLGKSGTDSTISIGKSTGPDSLMIYAEVFDETSGDPNDTVNIVIRKVSGNGVISADSICNGIIVDNDGPAYVKFVSSKLTVSEGVGSFNVQIAVVSKTDAGSDIRLSFIPGSSTAAEGSDFTFNPITKIISIDNSTPSLIDVNIPVTGDNNFEPNETILFRLLDFSNSVIQKPDSLLVTIQNDDFPIYKIGTINKQTNANKTADSANVKCRTFGTVYGVNTSSVGLNFTIIDNTGGMGVFSSTKTYGYTVKEGDSVMVQGSVGFFRGTAQMGTLDTIIRITNNRTLVKPTLVTKTSESTESSLIQMKRVKLVNISDWPSNALATNGFIYVPVVNTSGAFDTLNIDAETDVDGTPAPTGYFDVTGLGVQFDASSPFTSRYFIAPRYIQDITASTLPVIKFNKTKDTIFEPADSALMSLTVLPADENFTVDIVKIGGTAVSPQDFDYSTKNINVVKNVPFYFLKANNTDDNVSDGDKTLVFAIRNLNGPGKIGADSVLTIVIKDNEPSRIKSIREGGISVSPNPSKGQLNFTSVKNMTNISITDITGKVIFDNAVVGNSMSINLNVQAGIYTVKVTLADGLSFAEKLMITK